jgi:hypothetical protein
MGAPNSEVGYTSATTRWGDQEIYMDMWWHWGKKTAVSDRISENKRRLFPYTAVNDRGYENKQRLYPFTTLNDRLL